MIFTKNEFRHKLERSQKWAAGFGTSLSSSPRLWLLFRAYDQARARSAKKRALSVSSRFFKAARKSESFVSERIRDKTKKRWSKRQSIEHSFGLHCFGFFHSVSRLWIAKLFIGVVWCIIASKAPEESIFWLISLSHLRTKRRTEGTPLVKNVP